MSDLNFDNKQPHLTLGEVAKDLYGTNSPRDQQRVLNVYQHYADEFTEGMTAVVEMSTPGGVHEVRVFSVRGLRLLCMLARSKRAEVIRQAFLAEIQASLKSDDPFERI